MGLQTAAAIFRLDTASRTCILYNMSTQMPIQPDEIRAIRQRAKLTQTELAERLAVTRDTVASWEIGRSRPLGPAEILLRQFQAQLDGSQVPSA